MEPDPKKAEFVKQWRDRLAGMALNGLVLLTDEKAAGYLSAGRYALELPARVDKLLSQMYDHAAKLKSEQLGPLPAKPRQDAGPGESAPPAAGARKPDRGST